MDISSSAMGIADMGLSVQSLEDLQAVVVHLEDLEVFVGQRSRLHPGPGWKIALEMVRRDLALVQAEISTRNISHKFNQPVAIVAALSGGIANMQGLMSLDVSLPCCTSAAYTVGFCAASANQTIPALSVARSSSAPSGA